MASLVDAPSTSIPSSSALPNPPIGSLSGQMAQGQQIFGKVSNAASAIQNGQAPSNATIQDLLGAGITLAQGQNSSKVGTLMRQSVQIAQTAMTGLAVGGPFGAAVGIIAGAIQSIMQDVFGGSSSQYHGITVVDSPAAESIYKYVYQWGQMTGHVGLESGLQSGMTLADYIMATNPPNNTQRPNLMWFFAGGNGGAGSAQVAFGMDTKYPQGPWPLNSVDLGNAAQYKAVVQGVYPSVLWQWAQPQNVAASGDYYSQDFTQQPQAVTLELVQNDIIGTKGNSSADIAAYAILRAPDPMFYAADLFIGQYDDGSNASTTIQNCELLSMLATLFGLLSVGASTRAIVSELLLQQKIIHDLNGGSVGNCWLNNPYGQSIKGYSGVGSTKECSPIPPIVRLLVEDYVALLHAETNSKGKVSMASVVAGRRPYESTYAPSSKAKSQAKATVEKYLARYLG